MEQSTKVINSKISFWEEKLMEALPYYDDIIQENNDNFAAYKGTRAIVDSKGHKADKEISSVRKVSFELIESQTDVSIPQPRVVSVRGNVNRAQAIEYYLKNELERLPFIEINDEQERISKIMGGAIFLVEWDNSIKTRNTIGKLNVRNIHPNDIVPQPGVFKIQDMDYIFLRMLESKLDIKHRYGIDVSDEANSEQNDETHNDDLVTHYYVYYKNDEGYISLFSWVNNTIIQDVDNYFARKHEVCTKCGTSKGLSESCEKCGNDEFDLKTLEKEKLTLPMGLDDDDVPYEEEVEVDFYIPKKYPFVIIKNASELHNILGSSDVSAIKDQQNDLNIYSTKIREKLLKGGSLITLPKGINFKANNDELKIVEVDNPAQKDMIDVKSLQPSINNDMIILDKSYDIARQTIGITDSFQGRRDTTAVSGKAKEFAAAQTSGRLDSKRALKRFAYGQLFEVMFQFILAYADEPRYYNYQDDSGEVQYKLFDKRLFLDKDDNGEYFYDDEFIFSIDDSAVLSNNRRAMWEETRLNFGSGAYGNPGDASTLVMFWQTMDNLHYPGAKQALKYAAERLRAQQEMQEEQARLASKQQDTKMAVDAFGKMNRQQNSRPQVAEDIGGMYGE